MKQRFITTLVILLFAIPILVFSQYIIFPIALAALSAVAMYEILGVLNKRSELLLAIPAYIISALAPFLTYFVNDSWRMNYVLALCIALFAYMVWTFCVSVFRMGELKFGDSAALFALLTYVSVAFTAIALVRKMGDGIEGVLYIALIFIAAWATDVFAYLTGYFFGKHKLIPKVSPKKTVEGAIGGIVFAMLAFILLGFVVDLATEYNVNYLTLALSGVLLSVISQIGDLTASLIKREHGVKDYGVIFPGHGGVMDRFDSVIAVATPLMIICIIFPPFT